MLLRIPRLGRMNKDWGSIFYASGGCSKIECLCNLFNVICCLPLTWLHVCHACDGPGNRRVWACYAGVKTPVSPTSPAHCLWLGSSYYSYPIKHFYQKNPFCKVFVCHHLLRVCAWFQSVCSVIRNMHRRLILNKYATQVRSRFTPTTTLPRNS